MPWAVANSTSVILEVSTHPVVDGVIVLLPAVAAAAIAAAAAAAALVALAKSVVLRVMLKKVSQLVTTCPRRRPYSVSVSI